MSKYRVIMERKGADSECRQVYFDTMGEAREAFNHAVAMADQHGEWSRVQVLPMNDRNPDFQRPIMAYDSHRLDIEVINEDDGKYRWMDDRGTTWLRPSAWAYAQVCKARDKLSKRVEELEEAALSKLTDREREVLGLS